MSAKPDGDRGVDLAVTALVKNFECRSKGAVIRRDCPDRDRRLEW
jgi:hypothetical protein